MRPTVEQQNFPPPPPGSCVNLFSRRKYTPTGFASTIVKMNGETLGGLGPGYGVASSAKRAALSPGIDEHISIVLPSGLRTRVKCRRVGPSTSCETTAARRLSLGPDRTKTHAAEK